MTYTEYIETHEDELVGLLRDLIAFPSVLGDKKDGAPFGLVVNEAYDHMRKLAVDDGFSIFDADRYGGHIEWEGFIRDEVGEITAPAEEIIGIPVHLDVVPAGEGWICDPFEGQYKDGLIYGRGTTDNKGSVAALYMAMKALKNSGFEPENTIRLILGLDEETGSSGMDVYLEAAGMPDFGFVPDADFPAVRGEKGIIVFELAKKLSKSNETGLILRKIEGGNAANMVPDKARAILMDEKNRDYSFIKDKITAFREETGYKINGKGAGKAFEVTVHGVSAHAANPELGLNAISILIKFLGSLELANESIREFIDFYNSFIGFDLHGERMNIEFSDEHSGELGLNTGLISMDSDVVILTINVRYPVTMNDSDVYDAIIPLIHKHDLGIVKGLLQPPIFFSEDDPFLKTLIDIYRDETGDTESEAVVIGGGTYARSFENMIAYGPRFPGNEDLMHQKDEYISKDDLVKMTHIYTKVLSKIAVRLNPE